MKSLGGDPGVIGEQILINRVPATILGIAPRSFHGFGPERPPLWIPMGMLPAVRGSVARWEDPGESGWRIFGRLKDGGSVGQVNAELRTIAARSPDLFPNGPLIGSTRRGTLERTGLRRETDRVPPRRRAAAGRRRPDPLDRLLQRRQPPAGARVVAAQGDRDPAGERRQPIAPAQAAADREPAARGRRRRARHAAGGLDARLRVADAAGGAAAGRSSSTLTCCSIPAPSASRATLLFGLVPALHATRVDVAPLLKGEAPAPRADVRRGARVRRFFLVTQFASSMALLVVAGTFVRTIVAAHVGEQSALMDHLAVARRRSG